METFGYVDLFEKCAGYGEVVHQGFAVGCKGSQKPGHKNETTNRVEYRRQLVILKTFWHSHPSMLPAFSPKGPKAFFVVSQAFSAFF